MENECPHEIQEVTEIDLYPKGGITEYTWCKDCGDELSAVTLPIK